MSQSFTAAQSSSSLNPSASVRKTATLSLHESLHRSAHDQNHAHSAIVHSGHRASCHTQEAFSFPLENVSEHMGGHMRKDVLVDGRR